ncbi:MAG: hypothetical protein ACLFSQ_11270 [Candidatus Zixiibacteriota bacterium]
MKRLTAWFAITLSMTILVGQVPSTLNYQGKISEATGIGINDNLDIVFKIYDLESGGEALWSETHAAVPIEKGLFNVVLGETTPIMLDFSSQYYLEIEIDGDTMSPRQALSSDGYAFRAKYADEVLWSNITDIPSEVTDGDDWGEQVVNTGTTISGDGATTPLNLAQQGASSGQVLKWNGASWTPDNDLSGSGTRDLETTLFYGNSAGTYDINMNSNNIYAINQIQVDEILASLSSYIEIGDDIRPASDGYYDFGSSYYSWQNVYAESYYADNIYTDQIDPKDAYYISFGDDIQPTSDNYYDIGSSSREWRDLYIDGTAHLDAIELGGETRTTWPDGGSSGGLWEEYSSAVRTSGYGDDVVPNGTASLGTSSNRWDYIYAEDADFYGTIEADGLDLGYYGDITCDDIDCDEIDFSPSSRSSGDNLISYYGTIYEESSSRRFKSDIETIDLNPEIILNAVPKAYTCNTGQDRNIGLIAEELDSLGLYPLVFYDAESRPKSINYNKIPLYLIEILKEHQSTIKSIQSEKQIIRDFGTIKLESTKAEVKFSDDFIEKLNGEIPVITISSNRAVSDAYIPEKSSHGFTIMTKNPGGGPILIDWIAMAKIDSIREIKDKDNFYEIPESRDEYLKEWKKAQYSEMPK